MNFPTLSVVFGLLFGLTFAEPFSSSVSKHVRRSKAEPQWPVAFVMLDSPTYHNSFLEIYNQDGSLAYRFQKSMLDPARGVSNGVVLDTYGTQLTLFSSKDDLCGSKTSYDDFGRHVTYKIDPRGIKSDKWYIKIRTDERKIKYLLDRDRTDKSGKIYEEGSNRLVAELTTETRLDYWLNPGKSGVKTYTLHTTFDAPLLDLVTLMALVLVRVDLCGL